MKKRYYVKNMDRWYDLKAQKLKEILKIPNEEKIDSVQLVGERIVVLTNERVYDCRNIK